MKNFNSIYHFLLGTVRLKLYGDYCERLINILAANSISFFNLKKKSDCFEITIRKDDLLKIKSLRKNTAVKIRIKSKSGIPFIIRRYRHRFGIVAGMIIFLVILNFMSTRLWLIKINGNICVPNEEIIQTIEMLGVDEGASMKKIDVDVLKQKLISTRNDVAWASLNKQGSVLEVNITEVNGKIEPIKECNLVAGFDGVIRHIDVQSGTIVVKVGDTVTKGQLLVSGAVDFGNGNSFTQAKGKISAYVKAAEKEKIGLYYDSFSYNGKDSKRYVLEFIGIKVPLYLGKVRGDYDLTYSSDDLYMFGGKLPIKLTEFRYKGKNMFKEELNEKTAKNLLKEQIQKRYLSENKEIINISNENIVKVDDGYQYTALVDFVTDIAVNSPINYEVQEKK